MSDVESEKFITIEEDDERSLKFKTEDSPLSNMRIKKTAHELKVSRQKYCARWEEMFPWLKAYKADESLGICTICDKRLVVKKSHLERHQNSFKHQRLSGCEDLYKPESSFAVFLDNYGEKHDGDEYQFEQLDSEEFSETTKPPLKKNVKKNSSKTISSTKPEKTLKEQKGQLNRLKLLKRIDRDRKELNEYYYMRQKDISNGMVMSPSTSPKYRDSFDLFFDSVSASVKALPPKLSYELKSKISQLVSEFELRALCEKEAMESASREGSAASVQVTTSIDATMPHLVYTFQPKAS